MENTIIVKKCLPEKRENTIKSRNSISDDTIISSVKETKGELDRLRNSFNFVSDPKLVESIIYKERDAMARYEYLIEQAKEKGIKVSELYIYNNACIKY